MKNFVTKYAGSVGKRYKWLALASAVWLRGVSMVFGAPPTTVDWDTTNLTPLPAVLTEEKDTLILSDSPEYVEKKRRCSGWYSGWYRTHLLLSCQ